MEAADHMPPRGNSPKDKLRIVRPPEEEKPGRGYSLAPAHGDPEVAPSLHPDGETVTSGPPEPPLEPKGLQCRGCGGNFFRVLYTKPQRSGRIMRRRQCMNPHCGREITTFERAE